MGDCALGLAYQHSALASVLLRDVLIEPGTACQTLA